MQPTARALLALALTALLGCASAPDAPPQPAPQAPASSPASLRASLGRPPLTLASAVADATEDTCVFAGYDAHGRMLCTHQDTLNVCTGHFITHPFLGPYCGSWLPAGALGGPAQTPLWLQRALPQP